MILNRKLQLLKKSLILFIRIAVPLIDKLLSIYVLTILDNENFERVWKFIIFASPIFSILTWTFIFTKVQLKYQSDKISNLTFVIIKFSYKVIRNIIKAILITLAQETKTLPFIVAFFSIKKYNVILTDEILDNFDSSFENNRNSINYKKGKK